MQVFDNHKWPAGWVPEIKFECALCSLQTDQERATHQLKFASASTSKSTSMKMKGPAGEVVAARQTPGNGVKRVRVAFGKMFARKCNCCLQLKLLQNVLHCLELFSVQRKSDLTCYVFSSTPAVRKRKGDKNQARPRSTPNARASSSEWTRYQPGHQRQVPQEISQTEEVRQENVVRKLSGFSEYLLMTCGMGCDLNFDCAFICLSSFR